MMKKNMLRGLVLAALCVSMTGWAGISAAEPTGSSRRALVPAPVIITTKNGETAQEVKQERRDLDEVAPAPASSRRAAKTQKAAPKEEAPKANPIQKVVLPNGEVKFMKSKPVEEPVVVHSTNSEEPAGQQTGTAEKDQKQNEKPVNTVKTPAAPVKQAAPSTAPAVTAPKTAPAEPAKTTPVSRQKKIVINLASRLLTLYEGPVGIAMYPVAVGRPDEATPTGNFTVVNMEINPTWVDPSDTTKTIPSGPDNPIGYRWIGFGGNYGIHGTNRPSSIGTYASSGCVRMEEKDVEDLYSHITTGTPVEIIYERVVVKEDKDHTVSFYVYPDGYGREALAPYTIRQKLAPYGVDHFVSEDTLASAIKASNGQPVYVAKDYKLYVNGKQLSYDAMGKDGKIYLPFYPIAHETVKTASFDASSGVAKTNLGEGKGAVKGDMVYVESTEAGKLFNLNGVLNRNLQYVMTTKNAGASDASGVQSAPKWKSSPSYKTSLEKKGNLKK